MKSTLLLDRTLWDLVADAYGNIAVAAYPYAMAQNVACAIRLFRGELWYDTTKGVPYFQEILRRPIPVGVVKSALTSAALAVPDVVTAQAFLTRLGNPGSRRIGGQVRVSDSNGLTIVAATPRLGYNPFTLDVSALDSQDRI